MVKTPRLLAAVMTVLFLALFLMWASTRAVMAILFDANCGGNVKRAADANTIELARQEMEVVIAYLERHNLTSGYTSILYRTPDEDVGFWYQNLKSALEELKQVPSDATQLERTNVLMKLRETLVDSVEKGTAVTAPSGISIFPYNMGCCAWATLSAIASLLSGALWLVKRR